ncbi:hypothetical protein HGM15179_018791 [Zosterops borbonicus]|uniref:Uncharacterized protein n=1 Tax=Zosterops borbonicus TaxID=364589 RepID=A0A8K1FVQ4_9PASS|nr:hypothetical protein HGM15179_018791 [Zosterops borbonicus]
MFAKSRRTGMDLHENGVQEQWNWSQWTEPRLLVQTGLSVPEGDLHHQEDWLEKINRTLLGSKEWHKITDSEVGDVWFTDASAKCIDGKWKYSAVTLNIETGVEVVEEGMGHTQTLYSDNGSHFTSMMVQDWTKREGVK